MLVFDGPLFRQGAECVYGTVNESLPLGRIVAYPFQEAWDSIGTHCIECCCLFHRELALQRDHPVTERFAAIRRLAIVGAAKKGNEADGGGAGNDESEKD